MLIYQSRESMNNKNPKEMLQQVQSLVWSQPCDAALRVMVYSRLLIFAIFKPSFHENESEKMHSLRDAEARDYAFHHRGNLDLLCFAALSFLKSQSFARRYFKKEYYNFICPGLNNETSQTYLKIQRVDFYIASSCVPQNLWTIKEL